MSPPSIPAPSLSCRDRFTVLAYARDGRGELYGLDSDAGTLARRRPDVEFRLLAATDTDGGVPENVTAMGWIEDTG